MKSKKMVTGYHFGLASEEVDTYFAQESVSFAKRIIFNAAPTANDRTTSYAKEVCTVNELSWIRQINRSSTYHPKKLRRQIVR